MVEGNVKDTRIVLDQWGHWWRAREARESNTHPSRQSIAAEAMQIARVGARVHATRGKDADSIQPPFWIAEIDQAVDQLPQAQRAALVAFYLRRTMRRRNPALLRAEMALST